MPIKTPRPKEERGPVHASVKRSVDQEKAIANRIGGRRVVASGALSVKGDVRKKRVIRIEAKTTQEDSFRVTREMIRKITMAGLSADEIPAMVIELSGTNKARVEVAIVPVSFLEMLCEIKEKG